MKSLITIFIISLFLVSGISKPKQVEVFIKLDTKDTLVIEVIDTVMQAGDENDRYYYFEKTLSELLDQLDFPMEYQIERWPSGNKDKPQLRLYLHRWGRDRTGEIETRILAQLVSPGGQNKNKLGPRKGSFSKRDMTPPFFSATRVQESYNDVLKQTLVEIFTDLYEHIDDDVEVLIKEEKAKTNSK